MRAWLSLIAAVGLAFVACKGLPRHEEFSVGMDRAEIRGRFGEPLRSSEIRKTSIAVWGPIEEFWPRVPMDSTVRIWSYRTTHEWVAGSGERDAGTTELYFVDDSQRVMGLGFAPDGVVYEATQPGPD